MQDSFHSRLRSTSGQPTSSHGATSGSNQIHLRIPSDDDRIFGVGGIMYGVALKQGARRGYLRRPGFIKSDFKAYGNNGHELGSWWPSQYMALINGAHGSHQGGIAGNVRTGAYSVMVSGRYHELDRDLGDTLQYSGSNSHDNEDPKAPAPSSTGTLALKASLQNVTPVRVLRSSAGKSKFCPTVGIRYDGLYRVTALNMRKNENGGLYEQFRQEREPEQESLEAVKDRSPSARQRVCFAQEAVQMLHSFHIIHCDIKPENAMLDDNLQAYMIDFGGSMIDDKPAFVMENDRFRLPYNDFMAKQAVANVWTDMFALGSSIFEIMTSKQPYHDLEDEEVGKRYLAGDFPDITSIPCGDVILKCWKSEYNTVGDVHAALLAYYRNCSTTASV